MKLVVQVVSKASCKVDGIITGQIEKGYMVLVGFGPNDNKDIAKKMAEKLSKLRVFEDENEKMNLNIYDVGGKILSISQFTLYADTKKGNRPSFVEAMKPEEAKELYEYFNECLRMLNIEVETGIFGAMMEIALINQGPCTLLLEMNND